LKRQKSINSHAASISAWCAVLLWPSIVAAFTTGRPARCQQVGGLSNTAARSARLEADHSRQAPRAAATAPATSSGPAWLHLGQHVPVAVRITASTVRPVRISFPPTNDGDLDLSAPISFKVCFSSARSRVPGA